MDGREIERRLVLWALAEVSWQDASGVPCRSAGTLEDMSKSGACVRLKRPLAVGSTVAIKWQREHFFAIARNCRKDGRDFLVGLRREPVSTSTALSAPTISSATPPNRIESPNSKQLVVPDVHPLLLALLAERERRALPVPRASMAGVQSHSLMGPGTETVFAPNHARSDVIDSRSSGTSARVERRDMETKKLFPTLWRRSKQQAAEADSPKEVAVNQSNAPAEEGSSLKPEETLSYEDIYHAAGIMNPVSGYGIHKVIDMLKSERIRDLSDEIKRASVLMALDAAGTSLDQILTDARRRQEALHAYEAGKQKQLEDFEAAKARENEQIEHELERVRAHYAERMQRNRNLIAEQKEALRSWQMATQHEMQRIAEVIALCGKPAAASQLPSTGGDAATTSGSKIADQARSTAVGRGQ